jgi:hypothetical protein
MDIKKLLLGGSVGAVITLALLASISLASAALTFNGTVISGDSNITIDGSSSISIGTSTATGITIGSSENITTFPGTVSLGGTTTTLAGSETVANALFAQNINGMRECSQYAKAGNGASLITAWTGWESCVTTAGYGTTVHFAAGYYQTATGVTVPNGVIVIGDNSDPTIQATALMPYVIGANSANIRFYSIQNLTVDGNGFATNAVYSYFDTQWRYPALTNIVAKNATASGIVVSQCQVCSVKNIDAEWNGGDGIDFLGDNGAVANNVRAYDNRGWGVVLGKLYYNATTTFSGGMTLDGGDIENDTSTVSTAGALWVENTIDPVFVHHLWIEQSTANDVDGIRVSAPGAVITENHLLGESTDNTAWGLDIQSGANGIVAQNNYLANASGTTWAYSHTDPSITAGLIGPNYSLYSGAQLDPLTIMGNVSSTQFCLSGSCISNWGSGSNPWNTTSTGIYYASGDVGIGTMAPAALLTINATSSAFNGNYFQVTNTGIGGQPIVSVAPAGTTLRSSVSSNVSDTALTTQLTLSSAATTMTNPLIADYVYFYDGRSSGTLSNAYGEQINFQAPTGTATVTNAYGLYIKPVTLAINNYAIYSGGGINYFGGNVGIGTTAPGAALDINSTSTILEQSYTPATSTSACTTGMEAWDVNYEYRCVATNTWKRAALSTW